MKILITGLALAVLPTAEVFAVTAEDMDSVGRQEIDTVIPEESHYHGEGCDISLDEIVVTGLTGAARLRHSPVPVSVVGASRLSMEPAGNIVAALSREPGVSQISTGSGISKPLVRGLGFNRVLVVNDGIRQEGQQWGDEHGVEIDGNTVHSAEIVRGPASLMYGSDALAGVIIFNETPDLKDGEMQGNASAGYGSNNGLADYSLAFRGNRSGFLWDWQWSQLWAHDYTAPGDGYVPGTGFRSRALRGMLGYEHSRGVSRLIASYYHMTPEITEVGDRLESGSSSYALQLPWQQIGHYKIVSDNTIYLGAGMLKGIIGYQHNRRREFEEHGHSHDHGAGHADGEISAQHDHGHDHDEESAEPEAGLDFLLRTLNYDVRYVSPESAGWKYNAGVGGMWQSSSNMGDEFLVPAYRLGDVGVFGTVTRNIGDALHLSGGLRYDFRRIHSLPLTEAGVERFADFRRTYQALSGSIGAAWEASRRILVRANIARGFRAPNISETGSNGVHHGTFRYEIGDPDLKAEKSWQFDAGVELTGDVVSGQISLFANRIGNYIYLRRTGEEIDATPVYRFVSGDARLLGGELTVSVHPVKWLHFHNTFSGVDARLLHPVSADEKFLPYIPAPRWISTIHCDIPHRLTWLGHSFVEIEADVNTRQSHVMTAGGTETPTPGYVLWRLAAGTEIRLSSGRTLCQVSLVCDNIFDKAYQKHTSRLKYADTYALTGRYGYNDMGRNITVRVSFPFEL